MVKPDRHESLPYLLYHSTKLLCAECGDVLPIIDFRPLSKTAVLSCGHGRLLRRMNETDVQDVRHSTAFAMAGDYQIDGQ